MSEAKRNDDSGLWFSPQPPEPAVKGARNPDSVLFDLAAVAPPPTRPRPPLRLATRPADAGSSGMIEIGTLVAADREPTAAALAPAVPVGLAPTLVPVSPRPVVVTPAPAPRPVLLAIVGLLVALVALLGVLAFG